MRKIAIIGSGLAGLLTAHGLRRAGYDVTLYSDKTPEQWLNESRPTGTAARFELSLAFERELGLNHWETQAPKGRGVHLTFCPSRGNRLLTLAGRLQGYFQAVDLRLQSHRWMHDLVARGGRLEIEAVSAARLDAIAAEHELTLVAAGRAELAGLFERDSVRSVYDRPQRKLAMVITQGAALGFDGVPFLPVKFNFFAPFGEAFWVPYHHRDAGPSWCLLFEAKAGGPIDRFDGAKTGEQVLAIGKEVIRELMPWDYEWARGMELADPLGWLLGGVPPTVRRAVGRLPSGRIVMPLGDTAMSLDPIAGQGANNGSKMARHYVEAIVARQDRPFDEEWMTGTFERFYADHGEVTCRFNNVFLEPLTPPGQELLIAQTGSDGTGDSGPQRIADAIVENFVDPRRLTDAFCDMKQARALIAEKTGSSSLAAGIRGRLRIVRGQIRQKLGISK